METCEKGRDSYHVVLKIIILVIFSHIKFPSKFQILFRVHLNVKESVKVSLSDSIASYLLDTIESLLIYLVPLRTFHFRV